MSKEQTSNYESQILDLGDDRNWLRALGITGNWNMLPKDDNQPCIKKWKNGDQTISVTSRPSYAHATITNPHAPDHTPNSISLALNPIPDSTQYSISTATRNVPHGLVNYNFTYSGNIIPEIHVTYHPKSQPEQTWILNFPDELKHFALDPEPNWKNEISKMLSIPTLQGDSL